jgi:hypothetical protein
MLMNRRDFLKATAVVPAVAFWRPGQPIPQKVGEPTLVSDFAQLIIGKLEFEIKEISHINYGVKNNTKPS